MKNLLFFTTMLFLALSQDAQAQHLVQDAPEEQSWSMSPAEIKLEGNILDPKHIDDEMEFDIVNAKWEEEFEMNLFRLMSFECLTAKGESLSHLPIQHVYGTRYRLVSTPLITACKDGQLFLNNRKVDYVKLHVDRIKVNQ